MTTEVVGAHPGEGMPEYATIGKYRLLQQLGEGGMGVVHLALDRNGRAVAIKVLRPHVAHDPGARTRLAREVATLSRIRHPHVAPVIDADVEGPVPYIVTRYIAGPALDAVVDSTGPLTGPALLRLGRGLADALHAIHDAGVVHRDVKPGNVLLLDGDPVLIDFGIAHLDDDVRLTRTGLVMGTPGYLSPEIVEGGEVSTSTDWWGWAATLGFAASGRAPFGKGGMEAVLARVVRGDADLTGVDPALVPLLNAALSPEPADRPTDREVLSALDLYAAGGPVTDALRTIERPPAAPTQVFRSPPTAVLPITPPLRATAGSQQVAPVPPPPGPWQVAPATPGPGPQPAAVTSVPRSGQGRGALSRDGRSALTSTGSDAYPGEPGTVEPGTIEPDGWNQPGPPLPPRPAMAGDPRIGRATRSGTLLALGALMVASGAAVPWVGLAVALSWSLLARTLDRAVTSLVLRRHNKGARPGDVWWAVLATPVHFVTGVLATAAAALVPLIVGLAGVFATRLVEAVYGLPTQRADYAAAFAVGLALAMLTSWWGPGGAALRRGSRSIARGLAPSGVSAQVVAGLALGAALGLVAWVLLGTQAPLWWPATTQPPFLELLTNR